MSSAERPVKRRKFFNGVEVESNTNGTPSPSTPDRIERRHDDIERHAEKHTDHGNDFDSATISAVTGVDLSDDVLTHLRLLSGGNIEQGNLIFLGCR